MCYILHTHVKVTVHFSKAVEPPFNVPVVNIFPNLLYNFSNEVWVWSIDRVILTEYWEKYWQSNTYWVLREVLTE
jgi:hypothetical protein